MAALTPAFYLSRILSGLGTTHSDFMDFFAVYTNIGAVYRPSSGSKIQDRHAILLVGCAGCLQLQKMHTVARSCFSIATYLITLAHDRT